jgi:hypothetical protein
MLNPRQHGTVPVWLYVIEKARLAIAEAADYN